MTTALVKLEALPAEPLARIDDLRAAWDRLAPRANIVSPVASIDSILPMHRVSLRAVVIDPAVDPEWGNGSECYKGKFCAANERALGKVALEKIQAAAGVQIIESRRMDDRSDPHYCEVQVTLGMRDFDGQWRVSTKTRAVDLRDGSPDAVALLGRRTGAVALAQARGHIQQNAETKAGLRALRTLLTLKQKYTLDELAKPFVVPKLVPALDPSDPDQKKALIAMATSGERALFGPPAGETRELREVEALPAGSPPPPLPAAQEKPHTPPPVGTVASIEEEEDDEDGQLDLLDVAEPAKEAIPVRNPCGCPCACQADVPDNVAKATKDAFGSIRCPQCAPGKSFDYGRHRDLKTLELARYPKLTPDEVKRQLDAKATKR